VGRARFPSLADTRLRQPSWGKIAPHHDEIGRLLGVVPVSVIRQRLADEAGLEASVASSPSPAVGVTGLRRRCRAPRWGPQVSLRRQCG